MSLKSKSIRLLICLLSSITFYSCEAKEDPYKEALDMYIEPELQIFFPNSIYTASPFYFSFLKNPRNDMFISKVYTAYFRYRPLNFDSLYADLEEMSIAKYLMTDSCNIVVLKYQQGNLDPIKGYKSRYESWINKYKYCFVNKYPIPNFLNSEINTFSENELYIIESKSGIYFDDKYYTEQIYMPQQWERGYSNGIAVNKNEKEFIYWLVIW